ncbi:MAG: right-handed parallel beta-helix repeat-containing protein, partial [Candidatus Thermoplasmatota archaeon]|nr:right-handed parallel beta-helix repeat-containing protein [Candidatus Thermoplasmatota archaeon]
MSATADTRNGFTGQYGRPRPGNGRRKDKGSRVYVVIAALLISIIGFAFAHSSSIQRSHTEYEPHSVIFIDNDVGLRAQATAEGWQGNGSEMSPFVIEGFEIATIGHEKGIYVGNTSCNLVIENCYVYDAISACISLFNVTNATVADNECVNGQNCIEVVSSRLVSITDNNCTMASDGVHISDSEWCLVAGNNCSGNFIGINAQGCSNLSMRFNSARDNTMYGMQVSLTKHFLLANNTFTGGVRGVVETLSEFGSAINSTATNSSDSGFYLSSCHACSVEDSRSLGHGSCGISIEDSTGCRVRGNEASDNGEGVRGL